MDVLAHQCFECSQVTPVPAGRLADDFDSCPVCNSDNTMIVHLEPCPDPDNCAADNHDYGLDLHVIELDR